MSDVEEAVNARFTIERSTSSTVMDDTGIGFVIPDKPSDEQWFERFQLIEAANNANC